jgi:hypothetical protein
LQKRKAAFFSCGLNGQNRIAGKPLNTCAFRHYYWKRLRFCDKCPIVVKAASAVKFMTGHETDNLLGMHGIDEAGWKSNGIAHTQ